MRRASILSCAGLAVALAAAPALAGDAPRPAAFFGLTFVNSSPEATTAEEERRLAAFEARLRDGMEASGRYVFLDTAPVAGEIARHASLARCNGCDAGLAAALGAELAVTGIVQKTSNLILSVTVMIRDAATGRLVGGGSADMRGNTDESWTRAADYLLRNRILKG
jgi:hypothetical protein